MPPVLTPTDHFTKKAAPIMVGTALLLRADCGFQSMANTAPSIVLTMSTPLLTTGGILI